MWMCVHGDLQRTDVPFSVYSRLVPSVPSIVSRSTMTRIKQLLKLNEWIFGSCCLKIGTIELGLSTKVLFLWLFVTMVCVCVIFKIKSEHSKVYNLKSLFDSKTNWKQYVILLECVGSSIPSNVLLYYLPSSKL